MLYIRADMNQTIATGHVMRCLAIADAVRELGEDVCFLVADEEPVTLLQGRGYQAIVLHTDWSDMEGELPTLLRVIEERGIHQILIDTYQVTERYLSSLKERVRVCYMDDLNAFDYPVDMLICYASYFEKFDHPSRLKNTKLCLGAQYAPLRAVFRDIPAKQIPKRARKLLLLSGGTDPYYVLRRFLEAITGANERSTNERIAEAVWDIDVICGGLNQDYESLAGRYQACQWIHIHKQVSNIEEFMQRADIAVSAGGSTLYELCACGTPAISYALADNQLENVRQFDADGLIPYAGDLREDDVIGNVLSGLRDLKDDARLRAERSQRMRKLVDGRGALRIAQALLQFDDKETQKG